VETLPVRVARHSENAPQGGRVPQEASQGRLGRYPGLKEDPTYATASRYLKNGFGGMVVFGVKGGYDTAVKIIDNIKAVLALGQRGRRQEPDPSPGQHVALAADREQQKSSGLTRDLIRLSVGLEHIDDITGRWKTPWP